MTKLLDDVIEAIQAKQPDPGELLSKRDRLHTELRSMSDATARANSWTGSRESQGMFLYLTGEHRRALRVLEKEAQHPTAKLFQAMCAVELGLPAKALQALGDLGSFLAKTTRIRAQLQAGNWEVSDRLISELEKTNSHDVTVKLLRIEYDYRTGNLEKASIAIDEMIDMHPNNREALYLGALISDRSGDEDGAVERYERIAQIQPVHVDALVNLGVLYEDQGDFKQAMSCYKSVLRDYPNHPRAKMFVKDAEASVDMFYDEDRERREDKRAQVLRTPVTEFELSVRARNCLAKMKIETLADLIQKTELELLNYKNFGETSLNEIKAILGSRGLRLGMMKEEALKASSIDEALERSKPKHEGTMAESVDALELSVRARKCMERMNIRTIGDLCEHGEQQLLSAPNFGATSLIEVKRKLAEFGLALKA